MPTQAWSESSSARTSTSSRPASLASRKGRGVRRPSGCALDRSERQAAIDLAGRIGARVEVVESHELERPGFAQNPTDVIKASNPEYTRADFAVSYRFLEHWRAFAKFENITDEKYEDILTFPADGANTLAGLEFNWKF